jgi:predicted nucleic acid-binding protein
MICCIDAHTFIWGLKEKCDEGDEHLMNRAIYLFKWIDENKHQVMIPTVVLGEVLSSEPLDRYPVILDKIKKTFILADFDQRASVKYAQLFTNNIEDLKKIANEIGVDRQKMKIDHLIVACALVGGAKCIFSLDKGLKAFGQKYIDIRELPDLPLVQQGLFK